VPASGWRASAPDTCRTGGSSLAFEERLRALEDSRRDPTEEELSPLPLPLRDRTSPPEEEEEREELLLPEWWRAPADSDRLPPEELLLPPPPFLRALSSAERVLAAPATSKAPSAHAQLDFIVALLNTIVRP
jgi:hypothetical protein